MPETSEDIRARLRAQIACLESSGAARVTEVREVSANTDANAPFDEETERAFRKIERLAGAREQASVALRRRLVREEFGEDAVERAIERALACGLVDDRRYADVLVRSRLSQGKGRRGIAAELTDLGINPDAVEAFSIDDGDDSDEVGRALALLDRKPPRSKNRRETAYRRLAQKGFSASVASSAARQWCEANPE